MTSSSKTSPNKSKSKPLSGAPAALPLADVSQHIQPSLLAFDSTRDISPFHGVLGQERAIDAIQFGVAMQRPGYHIFVMGEAGTGRSSYVKEYLRSEAKRKTTPPVWCYVNHFKNPREPKAIKLPAGDEQAFKQRINTLIDQLLATFPAVFEHPSYQQKKAAIDYVFNRRYDKAIGEVEKEAHKREVAVYRDSSSISFTPIREGKALDESAFAQLSESERDQFHIDIGELEQYLSEQLSELPQWKRESSDDLRKLNEATIKEAIAPLLSPIKSAYENSPALLAHIDDLEAHLPRLALEELSDERLLELRDEYMKRTVLEDALMPNIATHHGQDSGAPVIYEPHPSYGNLFGRIEYTQDQGALVTNFQRICSGALHKANGGYLILDAEKVLAEPWVWDALKRSIASRQLKMESPYSEMGLINTTSLVPEVIELDIKLVLIGERSSYYLLQEYDPEFKNLFRTVVDFDTDLAMSEAHMSAYAKLLKSRVEEQNYADLSQAAVIRMLQHSARLAERQNRISARIGDQFDLLSEADHIRKMAQDELLEPSHINRALSNKQSRTGRVYDQLLEQMLDGTVLLDSEGDAIGKINGLTVMSLGDSHFGSPARITATVHPGSKGVVDIEREASLGQAIHSKGVMILSGLLGHRYAQDFPLAISAHLVMEQSYGYIDGDSASLAELCCLISALINMPIQQCFAVTGSINQYGEVQAIGGVNEKIEGFFRLCAARGLTGKQGVIIPASNKNNLVLNDAVQDAVKAGQFHIFAVTNIDEALTLLFAHKAGTRNKNGQFTANSINRKVVDQLKAYANMNKP